LPMSAICQKASQAGRKPKSRCNLIRLRNKTGENQFSSKKKRAGFNRRRDVLSFMTWC
jgi:hypothetical protein